jgi:hypothetical protein
MQMVDGYKLRKFGKAAKISFTGGKSDEYGEELGVGDRYLAIYDKARSTFTGLEEAYYDSDRPGDLRRVRDVYPVVRELEAGVRIL